MSECFSCLKEGLRGSATRQTRCPYKAKNGGSNPPPSTKMRIPLLRREPAAYIKLRRLGYAINTIARAFGRSSSVISRYVIKAILRGTLTKQDLRKIPNQTRRLAKARQWRQIMLWLPYWEKWICGEGDKPP